MLSWNMLYALRVLGISTEATVRPPVCHVMIHWVIILVTVKVTESVFMAGPACTAPKVFILTLASREKGAKKIKQ